MTSMTLSGTETSTGAPSRHHGGATALTNTTWLAAQQRKATHQPFQPRPLKMVANLEGKTTPRAPLVSRHAIGNVPAAAPATTEPKARAPSHASVRPREEKKPAAAAPADPKAAEKARVRETLASVDAEDDLRVIVDVRDELTQYEVQILRHMLRDRLEWDLTSPLTPEAFAQSLTRDLGLSTESTVLISHAVREQLLRHRRAALELGLFGSGKIYRCTMDELVEVYKLEQAEMRAAAAHAGADDAGDDAAGDRAQRRAAEAASALDPDASVRDEVGDVMAPPNTRSRRLAAGAAAAADTSLSVPFLVPDKTLPLAVRKEQALATLRDLLALGPRPLEGVWRDFHDAPDFGPLLEFLSEAEMEKMEEADMRASRYVLRALTAAAAAATRSVRAVRAASTWTHVMEIHSFTKITCCTGEG